MSARNPDKELDQALEIYNRTGNSDKLTRAEIAEIERLMAERERKQGRLSTVAAAVLK